MFYNFLKFLGPVLIVLFLFNISTTFAQSTERHLIEIKEGSELKNLQVSVNSDQTITVYMDNTALANALNTYTLYSFEKAFAKSGNPKLQRVYVTKVPNGTNFASLAQRADVEKTSLVSEENVLAIDANSSFSPLPSDYNDLITGGRNTALDLIKAPLAWSITTGDPNVVVGMSDGNIVLSHEDLLDTNIDYTSVGNHNGFHGTAMAGLFNAATNNNATGIASVAPDASLAFVETSGGLFSLTQGLIELIDLKNTIHPNLKIINCSWASTSNPTYLQDVMYGPDGIVENDILLIASAGNSNNEVYHYPASYPETMSITSVGHRVQIGDFHNIERDTLGNFFPEESWIDCLPFRPEVSSAGHIRNDRISVTAPGHLLTGLNGNMSPNDSGHPTGYWIFSATSPVAPIVSGVAALVQSVNPNLSAPQIKQLLEDTADDIYYIPYNQPYTGLLGTGRINAFRAVKTADCMANPVAGLDLAMQNSLVDYFFEPDTETEHVFTSKDIFVRNQNDGQLIKKHQNPEYDANAPNYVYIRVTNNSCETSAGNENLKLYWAKADTSLNWPEHWDGSLTMTDPTTSTPIIMGNQIGTLPIPVLEPGQSKLVEFAWNVPNPDDYTNINSNPWHFCLLARIDTPTDPMTVPETSSLYHNVVNNNNIVWKNITVVDILPDSPSDVTSVVSV